MRKYFFLMAVAGLYALSSCMGDKPKETQSIEEAMDSKPRFELTARDSSEVLLLTSTFLGHLKNERYDSAVAMLRVFDGDSLVVVSGERATTQKALFKRFHGIRYQLTSMQFFAETNNLVNYTVTLFDNEEGEKHANTVRGALNPVRVDGHWYLVAVDSKTAPKGGF